jgi:hypothetical protein
VQLEPSWQPKYIAVASLSRTVFRRTTSPRMLKWLATTAIPPRPENSQSSTVIPSRP